jgi:hypothetical protein
VGLMDAFRRAEEQARKAARAGTERAIVGLDDAERAIRRRMRIYPKQVRAIPMRIAGATAARLRPVEPPLEDPPKAKAS